MIKQIMVTYGATALAIGALIVTAPAHSAPAATEPSAAESCAADVSGELDARAESAIGPEAVPSLTWEQAIRMCEGTEPDTYIYEDGSWVIVDSDHEYADFYGCLPEEPCQIP